MTKRDTFETLKELNDKIETLGEEILCPTLPLEVTQIKRWQRNALMAVLEYMNHNEEAIDISKYFN